MASRAVAESGASVAGQPDPGDRLNALALPLAAPTGNFDTVLCVIDRSGEAGILADVGLQVCSLLTRADLDAARG